MLSLLKSDQEGQGFHDNQKCITDLVQKLIEKHGRTSTTYNFEKEESKKMSDTP